MSKNTVVLVEPVCRGSRLQWLWLVTASLQETHDIVIFSREDCETDHFRELMMGLDFKLHKVPGDFGGAWLPKSSVKQWSAYLRALLNYDRSQSQKYQLLFLALDDYFTSFVLTAWSSLLFRNIERCFTVKYRVACLTASVMELRQWVIGRLMHFACRCWKIDSIVLDERLLSLNVGGRAALWLPDPWFGNFSPARRDSGRKILGYGSSDFVALVIGRQDERKGFPFLLNALPEALDSIPELRVHLCGKIEDTYFAGFKDLIQTYGQNRIHHDPAFIDEEDLPEIYAMADVILMPYAPFFTSTSGVLPRASASGVPVAASAHGLVGDRVRRYPLGLTFEYGNTKQFVEVLNRLKNNNDGSFKSGCKDFASSCSEQAFKDAVAKIF